MKTATIFFATLGIAALLSGCSGVKDTLGLNRSAPDEFAVIKRAPLELPEDYTELPPPRPGAPRPQEKAVITQAQETIFGSAGGSGDAESSGRPDEPGDAESILLEKAGADAVDPQIRAVVDRESRERVDDSRPVADRLLFWSGDEKGGGVALDASREAQRLKERGLVKQDSRPESEQSPPLKK